MKEEITFKHFEANSESLAPGKKLWWAAEDGEIYRNELSTLLLEALASCTAVTYVDGNLVGDPLDVKMFQSSGWVLDETNSKLDKHIVLCQVYPKDRDAAKRTLSSDSTGESSPVSVPGPIYNSLILRRFDFSSALLRFSTICFN